VDKPRSSPHEGLDFVSYFDLGGRARDVQAGTPVGPMLPGTVVGIFPDFMGATVVVASEPTPQTEEEFTEEPASLGSSSGSRNHGRKHFLGPNLCVDAWPEGKRLFTIYAHLVVADGLAVGSLLTSPSARVGTVASARTSTAGGSGSGAGAGGAPTVGQPPRAVPGAPPHLHLSLAWAPVGAPPPLGWRDLVTPSANAKLKLAEPPIPAGFWE
jgi:hypothetical protein